MMLVIHRVSLEHTLFERKKNEQNKNIKSKRQFIYYCQLFSLEYAHDLIEFNCVWIYRLVIATWRHKI